LHRCIGATMRRDKIACEERLLAEGVFSSCRRQADELPGPAVKGDTICGRL
jgi:hypothetical protein